MNSVLLAIAVYVALLMTVVAKTVLHGFHAESSTTVKVIVQEGLHTLAFFCNITPVNLDFVGVNCCAWYCAAVLKFQKVDAVSCDWSILSVLPTAVKLTREGEGVTRELATGSITSSRVMEFTSNQASEMFPAIELLYVVVSIAAVASLVKLI